MLCFNNLFFLINSFNWFVSPVYAFVVLIASVLSCTYSESSVKYFCDFLKFFSTYSFIFIIKNPVTIIGHIVAIVNFIFTPDIIVYVAITIVKITLLPWDTNLYINFLISVISFTKYDINSPFFMFWILVIFIFINCSNNLFFKSLSILLGLYPASHLHGILIASKTITIPNK